MSISASLVKELREKTGVGMMDCKNALVEADGSLEKAQDLLRKKGLAAASKRSSKATAEGSITSYIHMGGQIGVLLELNCETDFVARNDDFQALAKDISMHIAASAPLYVTREEVPEAEVGREKEILLAQPDMASKPDHVKEKMVEGRLGKFYEQICLLDQSYVKDPSLKISELISQKISQIGENIKIKRFVRFAVGEE